MIKQATSGGKIRSTCLNQRCGFLNRTIYSDFEDEIAFARPKPRPALPRPMNFTELIEYLENLDKTPCCSEDFTTDKCMTIHCRCGVDFCGFCKRFEYEVDQDSIDVHVTQCRLNHNTVQRLDNTDWFKSPFPDGNDFDYHVLRKRVKFVNSWLDEGDRVVDILTRYDKPLLDAIAGVYIKDRNKTILHIKNKKVCVRYVNGLSQLFSVFEKLFIKELPTPANERDVRMNAVSELVREMWERLGHKVLLDRRYNIELFNNFTDQLLALPEQRMVHVLTIALSVIEESDEPTILFSATNGGIRL